MHFRPFDAQFFGLAVDALATGTLGINGVVEGAISIERDAHLPTAFHIDILDAALAFEKRLLLTSRSRCLREEQGATEALGTIAVGMIKLIGRLHAQPNGTAWHAISIALRRDGHVG